MLPELAEIETKLKEILYNCLEQIRATKAALYVATGDQPYALVTQYGFKDGLRKTIATNDTIVDILLLKRVPFFVNSIGEDSRFAEVLDSAATSKMMIAPIYSKGRLYGFVDMRDKAGNKPFDFGDSEGAQKITQQFLDAFAEKGLFGLAKENVAQAGMSGAPQLITTPEPAAMFKASTRLVEEARRYVDRGGLRSKPQVRTLTEQQVRSGSVALPGVLSIPGVIMAALSSFSDLGGHQVIAARAAVNGEALEHFQAKLKAWQQKRGEPDKLTSVSTQHPFGKLGTPIAADRLVSTLSAPVRVDGAPGVVLTVAFEVQPSADAKSLLEDFLAKIEQILRQAIAADELVTLRQRIAQKLIEPDIHHFPHLKNHSERVSDLAERLALFIGLEPAEVEKIRLAGYVHDVGMRLLDYQDLYRKTQLSNDDSAFLRNHPVVGAAIVADSPLGVEIANMVLHHHERPDGEGYPSKVPVEEIPIGARIIHICESFDAMTAPDSYQTPVPAASALGKIKRSGGTQFDQALAEKFVEMMSRE